MPPPIGVRQGGNAWTLVWFDAGAHAQAARRHNNTVGDPGRTRTSDQQLRRLLLCPAELRGRRQIEIPACRHRDKN